MPAVSLFVIHDNPRSLIEPGLEILAASDPREGLDLFVLQPAPPGRHYDLMMPRMSGMEVLERIVGIDPATDVILMAAHYSPESAIEGSSNVLYSSEDELRTNSEFEGTPAAARTVRNVFAHPARGPHYPAVPITGETGTGKDLIGPVASGRFVVLNRSAIVETLFDSELFGHGNMVDLQDLPRYDGHIIANPLHQTPMRTSIWRYIGLVLPALLLCQTLGYTQSGPQPPCGMEPVPPYPGLDASATAKLWSKSDFGRDWRPPACTGWTAPGFTTLVTIAARFRHTSEVEGLLRHIGAISERAGMRYWSTTHKQWQTLILDAYALTGLPNDKRREDFAPDEMKPGKVLYFEQADNLTGKAIYRMHIAEASANHLIFGVENASTMRYLFVPVFHPDEMQSIYFLDRESESVWRFYSIQRTGKNANGLVSGNESSPVNRAVAFYRQLVGIPTAQEPPAAR